MHSKELAPLMARALSWANAPQADTSTLRAVVIELCEALRKATDSLRDVERQRRQAEEMGRRSGINEVRIALGIEPM